MCKEIVDDLCKGQFRDDYFGKEFVTWFSKNYLNFNDVTHCVVKHIDNHKH